MNAVRVLVAEAEGSAPREAGAVMWVWADDFSGTIGGGALELEAIAVARGMLRDGAPEWHRELRAYPLGPSLGQCCGGMVRLLYEVCTGDVGRAPSPPHLLVPRHPLSLARRGRGEEAPALIVRPVVPGVPPEIVRDRRHVADWPVAALRAVRQTLSGERPRATLLIQGSKGAPGWIVEPEPNPPHPLYLYGAGHVGRAVVRVLTDLPFAITWVDVAADRFPETLPPNATAVIATDPAAIAAAAPSQALHLIMTFSHALDLSIAHAVLSRQFAWAGLIGSATKRARFSKRLLEAGIDAAALGRLHCPIGIGGITGKEPAMIAISVAAQLAAWSGSAGAALTGEDRQHG